MTVYACRYVQEPRAGYALPARLLGNHARVGHGVNRRGADAADAVQNGGSAPTGDLRLGDSFKIFFRFARIWLLRFPTIWSFRASQQGTQLRSRPVRGGWPPDSDSAFLACAQ